MIFMATSVMLTVVLSTKIFEFPMKQLREAIDRKAQGRKIRSKDNIDTITANRYNNSIGR